jgi:hypothetical protein
LASVVVCATRGVDIAAAQSVGALALGPLRGLKRQLGAHGRVRDPTGGLTARDHVDVNRDCDRVAVEGREVDPLQLELAHLRQAQRRHRRHVDRDQQLALLAPLCGTQPLTPRCAASV